MRFNSLQAEELVLFRKRALMLSGVIILIFSVLASRLWYLQIMQGLRYADYARGNRIRLVPQPALRGIIYDRNGMVLAENRPSYQLQLIREDTPDMDSTLKNLSVALEIPLSQLKTILDENRHVPRFKPVVLIEDLQYEKAMLVESYLDDLPGISVMTRPLRHYPFKNLASHILGYVGVVEEGWFDLPENKRSSSQIVGKSGVELLNNARMVGIDGGRQIEVDHLGRELQVLNKPVPPVSGMDLHLNLDARLQQVAQEAMQGATGVVIVMNPKTGEILALASFPDYDPNLFSGGIDRENWQNLVENPDHPLENKAMQGLYPLGSIFKIVTAYAGMDLGVIDENTEQLCKGYYDLLGRDQLPAPGESTFKTVFKCWKEGGHGKVQLHQAIRESCNVFFYKVGTEVGVDQLYRYASMFGLGKKTGLGLPHEKEGLVPNSNWKDKTYGEPWYLGETPPLAIGQGYLTVTPIQVLNMVNIVANRGLWVPPKLYYGQETALPKRLPLNPQYLERIREGMVAVVNEPGGTASQVRIEGFTVAGKTATSQVVSKETLAALDEEAQEEKALQNHGWFVAFGPAEDPEISVLVLVEHGGSGSKSAAPVAGRILDYYVDQIYQPPVNASKTTLPKQESLDTKTYSERLRAAFGL